MNTMRRIDKAYGYWQTLEPDRQNELFTKFTHIFAAGFVMGVRYGPKVKRKKSLKNLKLPKKPPSLKTVTITCRCGCAETFEATYRTNRPKYKNEAHKQRAYRERKKKSES